MRQRDFRIQTLVGIHGNPSTASIFVGEVEAREVAAFQESALAGGLYVRFQPCAHTKAHAHSSDQILIVMEGAGFVGSPDSPEAVRSGEIVRIPAGMVHVHGAGARGVFGHVALFAGRTQVVDQSFTWPPVADKAGEARDDEPSAD